MTMKRLFITLLTALLLVPSGSLQAKKKPENNLRLLYWNIQNGMWDGQRDNYDRFVNWVKTQNPDICVWCEGGSYLLAESTEVSPKEDRYFPAGWPEVAKRYGHDHVFVGGMRDPFPQVITSKYPIDSLGSFIGSKPDSVIVHGSGWAKVKVRDKDVNIITVHLQPYAYWRYLPDEKKDESARNHGGEMYRRMELEWIFNHTVKTKENPAEELWIMAGDFNARSRRDNFKYRWSLSDPRYTVHKYIEDRTPYFYDVVAEMFPEIFCPSHSGNTRIDYVYMTRPMLKAVRKVVASPDEYTRPVSAGVGKYKRPSDHMPIIVDFNIDKIK